MGAISVDAGTTLIKAVGYDDAGVESVVVRAPTVVAHVEPSWAEQDMAAVWEAVVTCVSGVARQLPCSVDFVAITAQGDGSWLVDRAGAPTGPAMLWNDGRASAVVEDWTRRGTLDEAFAINGSLTFAGLPNAILTWLQHNDPDRLEASAVSLTCGGWLFSQLTGERAIDESDASAPFLDIRTRTYAPELLRLYDMEWAQRLLPELRDDDHRVAGLTSDAAGRTGLPPGTPVVMCPYDIASTALGVGAVADGQACSILGTTLCTEVVTGALELDGVPAGLTVALGVPGSYLRAFPTLAGGEVIQWACALLGLTTPEELGALAERCPPGAGGLTFLPYLSPAGERAPFLDPLARGSFLGLSFVHQREQVARAVLEGLTFVLRDCLAAAPSVATELRVCGGGAANSLWMQLIADVTGVPVLRVVDVEVGARGAYFVGLVATGAAATVASAAARHVLTRDSFEPAAARAQLYSDAFTDFLELRHVVSPLGPRLAAMRARLAPPGAGR